MWCSCMMMRGQMRSALANEISLELHPRVVRLASLSRPQVDQDEAIDITCFVTDVAAVDDGIWLCEQPKVISGSFHEWSGEARSTHGCKS